VLYVVISAGIIILLAIIGLIIYNRKRSKFEEDVREEASKLIKKQNSGPVYSGL